MKGLDFSLNMILAMVLGVIAIVILSAVLSGNVEGLEIFAENNMNFSIGGGSS
ncbi:hypothetical protein HRED_04779 [Candidatus Haloredivivus sp. G17]|jgi:hypothetical protein|nr:hypothetical protein HRED_04779 [Candidatus Haloredivivus sp. G17]